MIIRTVPIHCTAYATTGYVDPDGAEIDIYINCGWEGGVLFYLTEFHLDEWRSHTFNGT